MNKKPKVSFHSMYPSIVTTTISSAFLLFVGTGSSIRGLADAASSGSTMTYSSTFKKTGGSLHHIAGYESKSSSVVSGSLIDLDQAEIEVFLNYGNFEAARNVFEKGAHCHSYAKIYLEEPIHEEVILVHGPGDPNLDIHAYGTTLYGQEDVIGDIVIPYQTNDNPAIEVLSKGQTEINLKYEHIHNIKCEVGGREEPKMDGCFEKSGILILDGYGTVDYHYDPFEDNGFLQTLYSINEFDHDEYYHHNDEGDVEENNSPGHFHHDGKSFSQVHQVPKEFKTWFLYYFQMDYGNTWIQAAFDGTKTTFPKDAVYPNEDFSLLSSKGRAEAIKTATVTMNIFLKVIRLMTEATRKSEKNPQHDHQNHKRADIKKHKYMYHPIVAAEIWDTAVATYTGSLEGPDGSTGDGKLLYALADQLCYDFATCNQYGHDERKRDRKERTRSLTRTTSKVNLDVIRLFQEGRTHLEDAYYSRQIKYRIEKLMLVPLIQGTLRSAYHLQYFYNNKKATDDDVEAERGRAVAFAASILPEIHRCSTDDAEIIYNHMNLAYMTTDGVIFRRPFYAEIKDALERNYECLKIQCSDIGGLFDISSGKYYDGAEPCGGHWQTTAAMASKGGSAKKTGTSFSFVFCSIGIVLTASLMIIKRHQLSSIPSLSGKIDSVLSGWNHHPRELSLSTLSLSSSSSSMMSQSQSSSAAFYSPPNHLYSYTRVEEEPTTGDNNLYELPPASQQQQQQQP